MTWLKAERCEFGDDARGHINSDFVDVIYEENGKVYATVNKETWRLVDGLPDFLQDKKGPDEIAEASSLME